MTLVLNRQFEGSGAFAGDGTFSNLAGTVPTLVDAGNGQVGLSFPSGAQSLVSASLGTLSGEVVLDFVVDLTGTPGGAAELAQLRGSAKVCAVAVTAGGELQVQGSSNATGAGGVPSGKFRVTLRRTVTGDPEVGSATMTVYTDDTGTTEHLTRTVACLPDNVTSVRLGWSGSGSTVGAVVSWPMVATTLAEVGPRSYGGGAGDYVFQRSYNGLTTLAPFTGDLIQQMIAGNPPLVVRSSVAKGLQWDGDGQGIVEHIYDTPRSKVVISRVVEVGPGVSATGEILQARASVSQRGPAVSVTSDRKLRLIRLSGTTGVSASTTTASVPTGRFRYVFTVDGANLTLVMYPDATSTTPVETLTSTTSDPIVVDRVREGIIVGTGIGDTTLTSYHPIDSLSDPGPRVFPTMPVEPPQAIAPADVTVDPWAEVQLNAAWVQETSPTASATWAGPGLTLTPVSNDVTFVAPADLEEQTFTVTLTITDTEGREGTDDVIVTVRPATYAERTPGDGWVPVQELILG